MNSDAPARVPMVEGWLLVLCVILTFVIPISKIVSVVLQFSSPALSLDLRIQIFVAIYSVIFSAIAIYSFVAGLKLWLIQPNALRFAKTFWWIYLVAHFVSVLSWILIFRSKAMIPAGGTVVFAHMSYVYLAGPILTFALWKSYLDHSKRVRETYTN